LAFEVIFEFKVNAAHLAHFNTHGIEFSFRFFLGCKLRMIDEVPDFFVEGFESYL
jgi:hypothetical protein